MSDRRSKLLLADEHPMILAGLRRLLEAGHEVVGEATDGRALLELARSRRPDLVLTDISMTGIDGVEAIRRLQEEVPDARVVIFSVHTASSWVRAAFDAGAYGYLTKTSVGEEIVFAVQEVLKGRFYVSPVVARAALERHPEASPAERSRPPESPAPAAGEQLTRREHDIVCLVGQGLGNKEIARRLGVAVTTVFTHLKRVYDKLGLSGRVGLALHAAPPSEIGAFHRTPSPSR